MEQIALTSAFGHVVLLHQRGQDLLQRARPFTQMPDPRAGRIQTEIDPRLQVKEDQFLPEVPKDDVIAGPDSGRERDPVAHR